MSFASVNAAVTVVMPHANASLAPALLEALYKGLTSEVTAAQTALASLSEGKSRQTFTQKFGDTAIIVCLRVDREISRKFLETLVRRATIHAGMSVLCDSILTALSELAVMLFTPERQPH